jgi:hypothetical protein
MPDPSKTAASERQKGKKANRLVQCESRALRIVNFVDKRPEYIWPPQARTPGRARAELRLEKDGFEIPAHENQFPARNQFARKNSLLAA